MIPDVPMSPKCRIVFAELYMKGPRTSVELCEAIWGYDDGPKWEKNDLRNTIWRANQALGDIGLAIKSRGHRSGVFHLVGVHPTKKLPHKQLDPWGLSVE